MIESIIQVGQGRFPAQILRFGQGGKPLLFLHGAGGLAGLLPMLERLGKEFEVIAPLHPGYGASTGEDNLDSVLDSALYHFDLLEEVGLGRAPILGHSMGGMIAAEMASLCPNSVTKLLLASPVGLWSDSAPVAHFFAMSPVELVRALWHDLSSAPALEMAQGFSNPEAGFELVKAVAAKFLWPLPEQGLSKRLHRIHAPTLILWGENDPLVPACYAEEFKRRITGSRVWLFPEAGHMSPAEKPELFVHTVASFVRS